MVDGDTSEWIVLGVSQGSVLGDLLFILYTCEMIQLDENRLYANADDSTLLEWSYAAAASLNVELARIHEWCNH